MARRAPPARYGSAHRRARQAALRLLVPGVTACARCGKPLTDAGRAVELDHDEDGGYLGLSHRRCNRRAAAQKVNAALGKSSRTRPCIICGLVYTASTAEQVSCGRVPCITQVRRLRRGYEPEPVAPPASGRTW